jgi:hypothetical protein
MMTPMAMTCNPLSVDELSFDVPVMPPPMPWMTRQTTSKHVKRTEKDRAVRLLKRPLCLGQHRFGFCNVS